MIRRAGNILGKAIAAVLSTVILILVGTGAMLSQGPVSVAPLAPYLEDLLQDPSWRFRVRFDDAVLSWGGWRKKLDVRVLGARIIDRRGAELVSVPSMAVAFDGQALLAGQFQVIGLELIEPRLRLLRHKDGRIEITNEHAINRNGEKPGTGRAKRRRGFIFDPAVVFGSGEDVNVGAFGNLRELGVRGADLSFHDAASGLDLAVPSADLGLRQQANGVAMRLSTRLRIGQSEASFGISALYRDEATAMVAAVNFAEVDIAALAKAIGMEKLAVARGFAVVAAGRLDLSILPDGVVENLAFSTSTGPGKITLPGSANAQGIPVKAISAKGHFGKSLTRLNVTDLEIDFGDGLRAQASGEWRQGTNGQGAKGHFVQAKGKISNFKVEDLPRYWPEAMAVDARNWVLSHIQSGLVPEARFKIELRPGDLAATTPRPEIVSLDWSFQDVIADYFGELPSVLAAKGRGHLDGRTFDLTVDSATAGGLQLSEGRVHVADLAAQPPVLDLEFVAHGPVPLALAILDAKPLYFIRALELRPEESAGISATRARFRIPLRADINFEQVGFSAAANLEDLALARMPGGYALKSGAFNLVLEQDAMQMTGQGLVNDVPLHLTWKRNFDAKQDLPGDHLTLRGKVPAEQWVRLGLPKMPRLAGDVAIAMSIDAYENGQRRGAAQIDLTDAAVDLKELGWQKPAKVPTEMKLTFQHEADGAVQVDHWEILGGGISAQGQAQLMPEIGLVSLHSDNLTFGATQLAVHMSVLQGGGYGLNLIGPSLDLRAFVPKWQADSAAGPGPGPGPGKEPPFDLDLQVGRILLTDTVILNNWRGKGRRRDGKWLSANMRGAMAGNKAVGFKVEAEGKGRRFVIVAGDAGGIARAMGVYNDARGGTMYLNFLVPDKEGPNAKIVGQLRADNFQVVKAPVLAQLLTLGSLQGLGDVLNDKGITFTRLDAPFTIIGDIMHLERARAVGPALAFIATGDYNSKDEGLEFQGTIVPSYTLNSVLGVIPILGNLLIGREGEGVFAFTYKVTGNLQKPKVSVNLLSALAPGFLRRIVEGLDGPAVEDADFLLLSNDR
ncbi:MAG: AsmA-like C-terminal domain-containing protein [Alphaproteobacteria bacterium]|nr:AsmA-like C-terminal domain-containing protein [Alphaproteobacteria bacterium]